MSMFDYDSAFQPIEKEGDSEGMDPFWVGFWMIIIVVCTLIGLQYFGWI